MRSLAATTTSGYTTRRMPGQLKIELIFYLKRLTLLDLLYGKPLSTSRTLAGTDEYREAAFLDLPQRLSFAGVCGSSKKYLS